jgi:hypothetical protein
MSKINTVVVLLLMAETLLRYLWCLPSLWVVAALLVSDDS